MKKIFLGVLVSSSVVLFAFHTLHSKNDSASSGRNRNFDAHNAIVYTTAENTNLRLSRTDSLSFADFGQPLETQPCVFVDPSQTFQEYVGIGGALTDASAETFAKLPKAKQDEILQNYFDPQKGIGYTLARTNIHSCDFSSDTYTYIAENDADLKSFSIDHDRKYRLPFIKKAIAAAGGRLTLYVSPWSPPAFMKDNHDMLHGGKLLPAFYQSWANYYIKFIDAYEKEGIPIWGLSVQNEPMAKQTWESCNYSADEERDFIKKYLRKKCIAVDHHRNPGHVDPVGLTDGFGKKLTTANDKCFFTVSLPGTINSFIET